MGVEMHPVTVKIGEAEHRKLELIEMAFSPFIRGRSATIRFAIEIVYSILFSSWTLHSVVNRLQGLLSNTKSLPSNTNENLQIEFEFPK